MTSIELIALLEAEKPFFEGKSDIGEVVLYGSALIEKEIAHDIDLLIVPSREMPEGEKVDLRHEVWERLKGLVPVMLEVQTPKEGVDKAALSEKGVPIKTVFLR